VVIRGLLGNPIKSTYLHLVLVHLRQIISNEFEKAILRLATPPYKLPDTLFVPSSKVRHKILLFLATAQCDCFNGQFELKVEKR